ncbi:N-acetylmuramoyl-L-alanine amidase, partial [Streptomyces sp. TRM76130]|nr:N-acetylmuramoyl-L-alanine amidase [Streptomyces sp. TRM76130]
AGTAAELPAVAGHDDGYQTSCPGAALSARLPEIRERAARLQGRATSHRSATAAAQVPQNQGSYGR